MILHVGMFLKLEAEMSGNEPLNAKEREHFERITSASHAVMTGSGYLLAHKPKSGEPKHLVTGNNLRASEIAGLATLLMENGVFTREEYLRAMADAAEKERDRLAAELSIIYGRPIGLV